MTDPSTNATPPAKDPAAGAARTGRRVGVALFWLMAVYVVGASTWSVVGQLYGSGDEPVGNASETSCAGELIALSEGLSAHIHANPGGAPGATKRWLDQWDNKLTALEGRCGRLETTRAHLRSVRARIGQLLHELNDRQQPELARITSSLEPFAASH